MVKVRGHAWSRGQGQVRGPNKGRWAHISIKLFHLCPQLTDILKFGIDKLLNNEEESASENLDFDAILGGSENGEWQTEVDEEVKETQVGISEMLSHTYFQNFPCID